VAGGRGCRPATWRGSPARRGAPSPLDPLDCASWRLRLCSRAASAGAPPSSRRIRYIEAPGQSGDRPHLDGSYLRSCSLARAPWRTEAAFTHEAKGSRGVPRRRGALPNTHAGLMGLEVERTWAASCRSLSGLETQRRRPRPASRPCCSADVSSSYFVRKEYGSHRIPQNTGVTGGQPGLTASAFAEDLGEHIGGNLRRFRPPQVTVQL